MASDPMGLSAGYGAATIPQTLDDLVKQRVLQQQVLLQMAEAKRRQEALQAEAQNREATLAEQRRQFEQAHQLNLRKQAEDERTGQSSRAYTEALTAGQDAARGRESRVRQERDEALGQVPEDMRPILKLYGAQPIDLQLGDKQRAAARNAAISAAGNGNKGESGLTPGQELAAINTLGRSYQTNTKASRMVDQQFKLMESAWNRFATGKAKDLNAVSQAILVTFQKVLDPESVVRESEYARSPSGQSMIANLEGRFRRIQEGGPGVTPDSLKEFVETARLFHKRALSTMTAEQARVKKIAERYQLPQDLIVADMPDEEPETTAPDTTDTGTVIEWEIGPNGIPRPKQKGG